MSRFYFFPVLEALNDGRIIRRLVSSLLYILSIATLAGGLYALYVALKDASSLGWPQTLLSAVMLLATVVAVAQIFWYRARSVTQIADSAFTAIPVVSVLFRTVGEMYGTLALALGLGGCLLMWLAKADPSLMMGGLRDVLPVVPVEATFLGGLVFLLVMVLAGFAVLLLCYFLAESSLVLVDVARHIRILVKQTAPAPPPTAPEAGH